MQDSGKVFLGLLAGVAIGATLGILFAPDKGEETRKKIATGKADLEGDLEERFDDFLEDLKERFSEVKDEAATKARDVKKNVDNGAMHANVAE